MAFVAAAFAVRLAFGLCYEFWADDELQIFLIGLRYYTTGEWPFFGPDVVYSQTRIPGALVGLLVGTPFPSAGDAGGALRAAESPVGSVAGAARLVYRPPLPRRSSMVSLAVGVFQSVDAQFLDAHRQSVIRADRCDRLFRWGLRGPAADLDSCAARASGVRLHGLWTDVGVSAPSLFPLLVPFVIAAIAFAGARGWRAAVAAAAWCVAGAIPPALAVIPTLATYGLATVLSTAGANTVIDASNLFRIPEIVARFLSFASFELPRFLGNNTASRLEFLARQPWSIPFAVFAGVLGLLQPLVLLAGFVSVRIGKSDTDGRRAVAWLALLTIALSVRASCSP